MKKILPLVVITVYFSSLTVVAQNTVNPQATVFSQQAMAQINPKHAAWVKSTAKKVNDKKMTEPEIIAEASKYASTFANANIDALVLLVMMESSKEVYKDIKNMMEQMEENRKRKESIRDALQLLAKREAENKEMPRYEFDSLAKLKTKAAAKAGSIQANQQRLNTNNTNVSIEKVSKTQIIQLKKELTDKRDSLSEMGKEDQLQLQKMMERKNQLESLISNTMKKISDSQSSIIQNLKAS